MEEFGPIETDEVIKNKSRKPIIFIWALLAIVIMVLGFVVLQISKPRYIFDQMIDMITNIELIQDFKTLKVDGNLEIDINGEEFAENEIIKFINDSTIFVGVEIDNAEKQEIVDLKLTNAKDDLLDVKLKLDGNAEKAYINLGELFEQTIELDDEDFSSEDFDIFGTTELTLGQKVNAKKATKILRKEIKTQFKDEYFTAEKVTVDGENLNKNTLKMTGEQLEEVIKNVCVNLGENQKFLECFKDSEQVKEYLGDFVDSVEELELEEIENIEISCYTAGLLSEVKKLDMTFDDGVEEIRAEVTVESAEEFSYKTFIDDEEVFTGKSKIVVDNENYLFEISTVQDEVETVIKVSGNVVYDEPITKFDVSNAVKSDELTDEDFMVLLGNFMDSKLYDVVEKLMGNSSMMELDGMGITTDDDFEFEPIEVPEEEETSRIEENTVVSGQKNVLQTYNDQIVKFNVPEGYDCYSSDSDAYKLFEKEIGDDYLDVDVSIDYSTMDEYVQFVKNMMSGRETQGDYANINLTEEDIEVNGNVFKRMIYTYDYVYSNGDTAPNVDMYIAHEVDSENLYVVEISGTEKISDQDLVQFLLIEK